MAVTLAMSAAAAAVAAAAGAAAAAAVCFNTARLHHALVWPCLTSASGQVLSTCQECNMYAVQRPACCVLAVLATVVMSNSGIVSQCSGKALSLDDSSARASQE